MGSFLIPCSTDKFDHEIQCVCKTLHVLHLFSIMHYALSQIFTDGLIFKKKWKRNDKPYRSHRHQGVCPQMWKAPQTHHLQPPTLQGNVALVVITYKERHMRHHYFQNYIFNKGSSSHD